MKRLLAILLITMLLVLAVAPMASAHRAPVNHWPGLYQPYTGPGGPVIDWPRNR